MPSQMFPFPEKNNWVERLSFIKWKLELIFLWNTQTSVEYILNGIPRYLKKDFGSEFLSNYLRTIIC